MIPFLSVNYDESTWFNYLNVLLQSNLAKQRDTISLDVNSVKKNTHTRKAWDSPYLGPSLANQHYNFLESAQNRD